MFKPCRKFRHIIVLTLIPIALSGCVAPIDPFTVVSLIADGVSYATTGKGPADHVISGVVEKDCAMYRTLKNEPVCRARVEMDKAASDETEPPALSTPDAGLND